MSGVRDAIDSITTSEAETAAVATRFAREQPLGAGLP